MKTKILILISIMLCSFTLAHPPTPKEQKQLDNMLDKRLNFTQEQKTQMDKTRAKHLEQMKTTVGKMQDIHDKIKDTYEQKPKYQADIQTAPMKAELAILKQTAQKQKAQNRKDFENILTPSQKIEFEKIKQERKKH